MEYKLLQEKYTNCCQLVTDQRLHDAFIVLHELVEKSQNGDLNVQMEHHRETFSNILRYSFGEVEDPEKKTVYYHLLRSVIELADEARESIISIHNYFSYCSIKRDKKRRLSILPEEIKPFINSLNNELQLLYLETESGTDEEIDTGLLRKEFQNKIDRLFNLLWLTDKYRDAEISLATHIIHSNELPWWFQSITVSAITLSIQRYFDETKLSLLVEAYKQLKEQVWQRALVGVIIVLYQYNQRLFLYPKIKELLEQLNAGLNIEKQTEAVIIQFIKTRDTEKIAQKFHDEILPEMARIQNRIHDKLDIMNMIEDPFSDEKNPDWEHVFEDSPNLLNKLEELSMLQMEGSDVFMSTFSMLKQFDFFNTISNWVLPFYKENPDLHELIKDDTGSFDSNGIVAGLEKSSMLCNSDKYSFCLNLKLIPPDNRSAMLNLFNMELKAMEEASQDDELLHKPAHERVVFTQYTQDLYRFYKLYSHKQEFYDIFSTKADFHNTIFFKWIIKNETVVRNIGEFFFEKGHYNDAIEVFSQIDTLTKNFELWQKIAYSYQKLGNYYKALEYYLKADLIDIKNSWNLKKIAYCYRYIGNYSKALEYYLKIAAIEPENLHVQANLAHTYLDMKDYENALKVYFKVEFLAPDNIKIQRPIAWCSFMLKNLDTAKKYFEKVLDAEGNQHDLLNLGHIEWCQGNKQKAIERYHQCIQKAELNFEWFVVEFMNDSEILIRYGIDPVNIPLMRDYLEIILEKER